MRIHTGERPYNCDHPGCGSSFITKGHLKDHSKTHTNHRPYKCDQCGKAFMRSTILKVHLRIHTGEKPYICPYFGCGKRFTESGNLNTHKKLHIKKKANKMKEIGKFNSAFTPCKRENEKIESNEYYELNKKVSYPVSILTRPQYDLFPFLNITPPPFLLGNFFIDEK